MMSSTMRYGTRANMRGLDFIRSIMPTEAFEKS